MSGLRQNRGFEKHAHVEETQSGHESVSNALREHEMIQETLKPTGINFKTIRSCRRFRITKVLHVCTGRQEQFRTDNSTAVMITGRARIPGPQPPEFHLRECAWPR